MFVSCVRFVVSALSRRPNWSFDTFFGPSISVTAKKRDSPGQFLHPAVGRGGGGGLGGWVEDGVGVF